MSMFSTRFLWRTSVYIAIGGLTSVMLMRSALKDRVRQSDYFRESMKLLREHEGANYVLGDGIKVTGFDISHPNKASLLEAYFEVAVQGSKKRGTMYFWADRPDAEAQWDINRIELEVKGDGGKRLLVRKKENETNTE